jgi:hypothetical protein
MTGCQACRGQPALSRVTIGYSRAAPPPSWIRRTGREDKYNPRSDGRAQETTSGGLGSSGQRRDPGAPVRRPRDRQVWDWGLQGYGGRVRPAEDGVLLGDRTPAANAATWAKVPPKPDRIKRSVSLKDLREWTSGSRVGQSSRVSHLSLSGKPTCQPLAFPKKRRFHACNILSNKDL